MVDAGSEPRKHQTAHQKVDDKILELERLITEWVDGHPTFSEEFELFDETPEAEIPSMSSTRFDVLGERDEIGDKWGCVFKFGYLQGIEAHAVVDSHTGVP